MLKIENLIGRAMTGSATQARQTSQIIRVGRHHSATASGDVFTFENHWRSLGWHTGGYHEIILRDGSVQLCYAPTTITNGIANHNHNTYHICLVGNGSFTDVQEQAFVERAQVAMKAYHLNVSQVLGHGEFQGATTACPAINMNHVRNRLQQLTTQQTYLVQQTINGFMTAADARDHRNPRTTVQPRSYYIFNEALGMINVTTRQGHAGSWINPAHNTQANVYQVPNYSGTSLVDALKKIQVDSSFTSRDRIAQANGIANYTGTAAQNSQILNLLMAGRLIRP